MKRSAISLQFIDGMATNRAVTPSRSSYRGGRKQWGRGLSDRPYNEGRGQQVVTGDAHFRSVRDSNSGIRQAGGAVFNSQQWLPRLPRYNPNQQFRQPPPFVQNQNPAIRPPQQFRPRPPKPLDYRDWEYANRAPPPDSEKFIVLSYNILADYLAFSHRSKLYFHIPRHMLDWEWRKRNILFELNLWSADIMCFQEVDRFQDLAEELKLRGYDGIWKMRTGNAVDGCAIFWRTSRFKLLYEESIEFNKLGLRDNVAQICVLELTNKSCSADTLDFPTSPASSDKVVICNIHVLYNPKRGEIKLGQVRTLLDKAYDVSQMWNAPVVLCGDFNCIPKSPLYNFISEQKLDLSGIDRDKVSGQACAEICAPRPYKSNPNPNLNANPNWTYSSDDSNGASVIVDNKLDNFLSGMQKQNNPKKNENIPTTDNSSLLQSTRTILDVSDVSFSVVQCGKVVTAICAEETKQTQQDVIDNCKECTDKEGIESTIPVLVHSFEEKLTISHSERELPVCHMNELIHKSTPTVTCQSEDSHLDENQMQQARSAFPPDERLSCEHSHSNIDTENKGPSIDNLAQSLGVSPLESSRYLSSQLIVNDDNADLSAPCQANISSMSASIYHEGDKKQDDASPLEINDFPLEGEMIGEDQDTFLSALHNTEDSFQPEFGQIGQSDLVGSQNELASDSIDSEVNSPSIEVLDDLSPDLDSDSVTVDKTAYDPSLWTPMEIATATGNADCIFLEHPLKLKSTYAEVEANFKDCSGTRDPNGEPLVTSYNRCFSGTVDYIWSSEALKIVRVLAPIPKHAMQWTPGFPTKKWGSDHIALASELAFAKDATDKYIEVQHHED